jgi:hypothetical protein
MNSGLFKKILPHLIAVLVFLVVTIYFCKPVLDGNVLQQGDIMHWKGMAQNAFDYKEKHGHFPLWNPNLFSGMPNYQVAIEGKSILPDFTSILTLWLPKPMNFFFLACICFYILCLALRAKPVTGILGALAFAFSTYNPIIIGVGHESKMYAIAYMPLLLAGIIFTYEKKYWLGLSITTLGAYTEIAVNHPQINFYFLLAAFVITLAYLIKWIKQKEWKHILTSGVIVGSAALLGVAASAVTLFTTYEYGKATMRGGKDISIQGEKVESVKTTGLDTSYAFQYSLGKAETAVMLMPNAFGSSSSKTLKDDSHVVGKLTDKGVPEAQAIQVATSLPAYWGGIDGVGTAGPPYMGVVICFLAIIGFVIVKHPLRWGLLAATVLGIMMAWGKYLPGFNTFLFNHLPMYNKFRAPSMTLVIAELTLPVTAVLSLQYLLFRENSKELLKENFKKILFAVGGLFALLLIMYVMMDYSALTDNEIANNISQQAKNEEIGRVIIAGMKADRRAMFGGQMLRAFGFAIVLLGLLYLYLRNRIKPLIVAIALVAISTIDLLVIDKDYLGEENYVPREDVSSLKFTSSEIDQEILKDKDPDYRVFNAGADRYSEARTPSFHKSIGGYHPAKLRIYQDVIDKYLSAMPDQNVLNMLNAKYIVFKNPQTGKESYDINRSAYGACWLVKGIKFAKDQVEEIQLLGTTNLKDTVVVQENFRNTVNQPKWDSASSIKLEKFDNDTIEYSTNSNAPQFAVLSEMYYPMGWNAYLDGKKTEYCKADYILRGISLPPGNHNVKFIFEPSSYKKGVTIAYIASFLVLIFILGGLFMEWKTFRKKT